MLYEGSVQYAFSHYLHTVSLVMHVCLCVCVANPPYLLLTGTHAVHTVLRRGDVMGVLYIQGYDYDATCVRLA